MPTDQRPGAEAPEDLLAEAIDPPANEPESDATSLTRRARVRPAARPTTSPRRASKAVRPASARPAGKSRITRPVRSLVILTMVGGLVATVAIPAFAAAGPLDDSKTLQQVA